MSTQQTVAEVCQIDIDILYQLSESNGYWSKSHYFYEQIKDDSYNELTLKQKKWLDKITEDYEEAYEKIA